MSENPWTAIQSHRHDIQNYLQLIKAYLQLGRPERAMQSVDDCSAWLGSLSVLQNQLPETAGDVLWTALSCSHLRIEVQNIPSLARFEALCRALRWLEEQAVAHNNRYIHVTIDELTLATDKVAEAKHSKVKSFELRLTADEELTWLPLLERSSGVSWLEDVQVVI